MAIVAREQEVLQQRQALRLLEAPDDALTPSVGACIVDCADDFALVEALGADKVLLLIPEILGTSAIHQPFDCLLCILSQTTGPVGPPLADAPPVTTSMTLVF